MGQVAGRPQAPSQVQDKSQGWKVWRAVFPVRFRITVLRVGCRALTFGPIYPRHRGRCHQIGVCQQNWGGFGSP